MNNNTQHGRQPTPQQAAPPTDPRTRNLPLPTSTAEHSGICRDYIWGICTLRGQCRYRHDLEFHAMKAVLKFCHDHQNRTGCTRSDCTYLHTSREEENIFLTIGTIPKILRDRYAIIDAPAPAPALAPGAAAPESIQNVPPAHNMMYEYIMQPPPPPPPPPPATAGPSGVPHSSMPPPIQAPMLMHGPMQAPMQGPLQGPMQAHMQATMPVPATLPPMPAPMPAPMPPPPPPSSSRNMHNASQVGASVQVVPPHNLGIRKSASISPTYTGVMPPPQQNLTAHYLPPMSQQPLPPMFDPTRPPPPLPPTASRPIKRPGEDCEAGPSKLRKTECSNDSSCENCVQRLLRTELYNHQIGQLQQENDMARVEITNKMEEFEKKKQLLRKFVSQEMYRRTEDYIENGSSSPFSQWNDMFTSSGFYSKPLSAATNANNNMVHQLVDLLFGRSRGVIDPMPSTSSEDALLQLTGRSRPNNGSTDVLTSLLELLRNVPSLDRSSPVETRPSETDLRPSASGLAGVANGFNRFLSDSASPPGPSGTRYPPARPFADGIGAGPSTVSVASRPYGESPAVPAPLPASLATSSRPYSENIPGPAVILPYVESTAPNPHPYAENSGPSYPEAPPRPYGEGVGPRYGPPPAPGAPPRQYHPRASEGAAVPPPGPAAPPLYMPGAYSTPTQPPATRAFYGPFPNSMPNPPYPGAMTQPQRHPMPPQNTYFLGGRFPPQNYYPPYQ